MKTQKLLEELLEQSNKTCISISLPTHRTFPDNQTDILTLKNLVLEASKRLSNEVDKSTKEKILSRLFDASTSINHDFNSEGLSVFANQDYSSYVRYPFTVKSRCVIDTTFEIRYLVKTINRGLTYFVLDLSIDKSRLYEGYRETLTEITNLNFPFESHKLDNQDFVSNIDNKIMEYFGKVDKNLSEILRSNSYPIVLTGSTKNIGLFEKVSKNQKNIITAIDKNFSGFNFKDFGTEIWYKINAIMEDKRLSKISFLDNASASGRVITDIQEIYNYAISGRGEIFFVEEEFSVPAKISIDKQSIDLDVEERDANVSDDILDVIIERVIEKRGIVIFMPVNSMNNYGKVALVVRY